jgi:hypothetical protein
MSEPIVTIKALPFITLVPGGAVKARLTIAVTPTYHVQANPASDPYLVPLYLALRAGKALQIGKPLYPVGLPYRLEGAPDPLSTYNGTFEVVIPVAADNDARPGDYLVRGGLRYQACDSRTCFFPASAPILFTVEVLTPVEAAAAPVAPMLAGMWAPIGGSR